MTAELANDRERFEDGASLGDWWRPNPTHPERMDCLLCPRECNLKPGDRGFCFVRENRNGQIALTTYGKSTGFCIDPIEKKPLNHFLPGTPVLSFGTAGCNLGCKFCQNWDISKSREIARLSESAEPEAIARAASASGCASVAYTYNDPVIWAEYAIDTARACRDRGVKNVAVTAGYVSPKARAAFFAPMDAANVDLKAFSEDFYRSVTYSHLQPVLDTLVYLQRETEVWFELTNLIIPGENDSPGELGKMCDWIVEALGDQVPIHFTAFHPDFRMMDRPSTDPETLLQAHERARSRGLKYVYVGNIHDLRHQSTYCHGCGQLLIERDGYRLGTYQIDVAGCCPACQTPIPGRFAQQPGDWGARRQPIRIAAYRQSTAEAEDKQVNQPASQSAGSATTAPEPKSRPQLLDAKRLSKSERQQVLQAAAAWLAASVTQQPKPPVEQLLGPLANGIVMGAFVTVKRGDLLRGCCGVLGKPMSAGAAITGAAAKTAKEDQRLAAISPVELPYLSLDVTLLGPFRKVEAAGRERIQAVQVGRHGLMIQRQQQSGLLLPSVATERGWDAEQFLQAVCSKANLPIGAWESPDCTLFTFDGTSMGTALSDVLPPDTPLEIDPPVSAEQLAAYARVAGDNIVALVAGGTPSYVLPNLPDVDVNAIVLSMQWGSGADGSQNRQQANSLQVSFRPGVPLQSTLFQMCQRAAAMFQQQRFAGELKIGLSLGFDPALHGFGTQADLTGVEARTRGVVISDARHCGLAFHPEQTLEQSRDQLRKALPIKSRDAQLHTLRMLSTMPHVVSVAAPTAIVSKGIRPAAVAGKFYPAEDAARRSLIEGLCPQTPPESSTPLAIMVPHAGLKYSGKVAAAVWSRVAELDGRTLVVVSPKHTSGGVNWAVCPFESWRVSKSLSFASDRALADEIAEAVTPIELDSGAHQTEHGIEVQLPFLERFGPHCKVVGLALSGGSWEDIQAAAVQFADVLRQLPEKPLLVISSDMNHYAPDAENRRRDRLALDALQTGEPQHLIDTCHEHEVSMCGLVPAAFVMETLNQLDQPFRVEEVSYATSGEVSGDKSHVVGYAGVMLQPA